MHRALAERNGWLWMLPVLLLSSILAASLLDEHAFDVDEVATVKVAGGPGFGPHDLLDTLRAVARTDPAQAPGLPLLVTIQGAIFGWREVALRSLSFFCGLLALAWVYRLGRALFSPPVGFMAALFLTGSVFFLTYFHIARAYMLSALVVTMALWFYWRCVLHFRRPQALHFVGLLASACAMFWSHYFAIPLFGALGLWHLFFARRGSRWWRVVAVLQLAALLATPALVIVARGLERSVSLAFVGDSARILDAPGSLAAILHVLTNGLIARSENVGMVLYGALVAFFLLSCWRLRRSDTSHAVWMTVFLTSLVLLTLPVFVAEFRIMVLNRVRYFITLWPLFALLLAYLLGRLGILRPRSAGMLLALWLALGIMTHADGRLRYRIYNILERQPLHHAQRALERQAHAEDLLLVDSRYSLASDIMHIYTGELPLLREEYESQAGLTEIQSRTDGHARVWLLGRTDAAGILDVASGWPGSQLQLCERVVQGGRLELALYAREAAGCRRAPAGER